MEDTKATRTVDAGKNVKIRSRTHARLHALAWAHDMPAVDYLDQIVKEHLDKTLQHGDPAVKQMIQRKLGIGQ